MNVQGRLAGTENPRAGSSILSLATIKTTSHPI